MTAQELQDRLGRVAAVLTPRLRAALAVLAVAGARRSFVARQAPDGTPWAPLARTRPTGGSIPLRSTGQLLNSLASAWNGDELALSVNGVGARLQHFGGTIRPVKAKVLTIPLTAEAERSNGPRSMPGLVPTAGGLGRPEGKRGKLKLHWAFADSVTVPARPLVGFSNETLAEMGELAAGEQARTLAIAFGS